MTTYKKAALEEAQAHCAKGGLARPEWTQSSRFSSVWNWSSWTDYEEWELYPLPSSIDTTDWLKPHGYRFTSQLELMRHRCAGGWITEHGYDKEYPPDYFLSALQIPEHWTAHDPNHNAKEALRVDVSYSEEDECFISKVDGQYISAHGETATEALAELAVALDAVRSVERNDEPEILPGPVLGEQRRGAGMSDNFMLAPWIFLALCTAAAVWLITQEVPLEQWEFCQSRCDLRAVSRKVCYCADGSEVRK